MVGTETYARKWGLGCFGFIFGLPFFGAGLFVIYSGFAEAAKGSGGGPASLLGIIPFGLIFVIAGASVMFGRKGVVVDPFVRTAYSWWGLLVPFKKKYYEFGEDSKLAICKETRRTKNSTYTVFVVRFLSGKSKGLLLDECRDYPRARKAAEKLAKMFEWPLHDRTGEYEVVRLPEELDMSLREQLRHKGQVLDFPEPPEGSKVAYEVAGDEVILEVPPAGFGLGPCVLTGFGVIALVGLTIGGMVFYNEFLKNAPANPQARIPIYVFAGVFGVAGLAVALALMLGGLRMATSRDRIHLSAESVRLFRRDFLFRKTVEIPSRELEQLDINEGKVRLISDSASMQIGEGLSVKDRDWLKDVIGYVVTALEGS